MSITQQMREQLKQLIAAHFNSSVEVPEDFTDVTFPRTSTPTEPIIKVVFADYIIKPFKGFDFHDKFNDGVPPYNKVMYGKIIKETPGMYYFEVRSETSNDMWRGWCPKKSCTIE